MVRVVLMGEITDRERAIFECGIKLGGLFHQFVGTPVSPQSLGSLERAMEEAVKNQPFVQEVTVQIRRDSFKGIRNRFQYLSLEGKMIDARVTTEWRGVRCTGRLHWVAEEEYPLMEIESVGKG
jgi:dihydroneopterin aldolase